VFYLNSGTWIESPPCPFVAVKGQTVDLEYWPPALTSTAAEEHASGHGAEAILAAERAAGAETP
jgi:hypothetical protein